jgi:hypothetical protein
LPTQTHPLESFFHRAVRNSFVDKVGLNDPEIAEYVAHMLWEFSQPAKLYRLKDATGRPIENIVDMVRAADPVYGTAASFDEERAVRKYLGDYALYVASMQLDVMESSPNYQADRAIVEDLIRLGKQSYFIVSKFDLFEYENEAALFTRLSGCLDRCVLGIALVRDELKEHHAFGTIRV